MGTLTKDTKCSCVGPKPCHVIIQGHRVEVCASCYRKLARQVQASR
jgi:hypothetical protein